jgi:hypothetical protein
MSEEEIEALKRIEAEATPGPWFIGEDEDGFTCMGEKLIKDSKRPSMMGEFYVRSVGTNDAAFIAAARTAVPALLSDLAEARRRIAELERVHPSLLACYEAAKEAAIAMNDLPPETAVGESGRDLIRALEDARVRYEIDSMTEREIEANYNAMGRPPAPPGWSSKP